MYLTQAKTAIAKRFRVALSFIYKLLKLYREKGTFEPKSHGGGQSMKLSPENIIVLGELVGELHRMIDPIMREDNFSVQLT